MNSKKQLLSTLVVIAIFGLLLGSTFDTVSAKGKSEVAKSAKPGNSTIVEIVLADDGEFDLLQAAVVRAGLVDALNGKKQYTVFAPTDQAFMTLLGVTSEMAAADLINAMPVSDLSNVLLFHVTHGRRISSSVIAAPGYMMLNGDYLSKNQLLTAGVVKTDISASNGIVHVISNVLIP